MIGVFEVAPKRVAGTSRAVLPHEKSVTVTTAAQHTSSPFSESVGESGAGLPCWYGIDCQCAGRNVVIVCTVSWIKKFDLKNGK